MKYKNAGSILPEELINMIQEYVQGEYVYIPIKDKKEIRQTTEYDIELEKRDEHIYTKHLEGVDNKTLSQLYHLSESSIRRIIVNQRKEFEKMQDRIKNVISNWDIEFNELTQVYDSAWQVGENYILKIYDDVKELERNTKIVMILDDMNIPVGSIVCTKDSAIFAKDDDYYYVLSKRLKGSNVVNIKDDMHIAYKMGRIIAELHIAFKECEEQDEFWENSLLGEMNSWIRNTLSESRWKYVSEEKFEDTVSKLDALYQKLPVQLIHRDVHFGNFLFHEGEFSGYIDFDLSQRNIRIFDVCYFLLALLSEEEKLDITSDEWFEIMKNVLSGYEDKIKMTDEEKSAIPYVMKSIELLFVAWFISENDMKCAENAVEIFEFVDKNEDKILEIVIN